jgi:hypothetical protein
MEIILRGVVAVAVLCSALLILVALGTPKNNSDYELVQSVDDAPLQKNSQFQFQVPLSQLDETKVGDVIQGQVPVGGSSGGQVAFTGQVTSGRGISSSTGSLTVILDWHYFVLQYKPRRVTFRDILSCYDFLSRTILIDLQSGPSHFRQIHCSWNRGIGQGRQQPICRNCYQLSEHGGATRQSGKAVSGC